MDLPQVVITALAGVLGGGGLAALANAVFGRSKGRADAATILVTNALTQLAQAEHRADQLETKLTQLVEQIDEERRKSQAEINHLNVLLAERDKTIVQLRRAQ